MMENSIPETVTCILCQSQVIYRDGDKLRFREHLRNEHGAFFDLDYMLASCLMDPAQKESVARTVQAYQYAAGELQTSERVGSDMVEETLKENTNYDKDDQTNQPEFSEQPNIKKKKKPGRKKAANVVGEDSLTVYPKQEVEETSFSDQEVFNEGVEEQVLEVPEVLENGGGVGARFVCQVESCGKSYNSKGNRMTHEKKAHGILGPRAAKRQRMSVSTEDSPAQPDTVDQQPEVGTDDPASVSASSSFLTDSSLMEDDVTEESEAQVENTPEEDPQSVAQSQTPVDLSSSKYFEKNSKMIANARGSTLELFEVNPVLPQGWRQRTLEVTSKKGDKITSRHYLSPELKVLRSGMAVVEYLRIKGEMDLDQLKQLAKDLNVAEKKFQSLFSE